MVLDNIVTGVWGQSELQAGSKGQALQNSSKIQASAIQNKCIFANFIASLLIFLWKFLAMMKLI